VTARFAALESTVRAIDIRLESLERQTRASAEQLQGELAAGFQEVASRALVLAEATDEILTRQAETLERIEAALAALPREIPAPVVDVPTPEAVDLSGVLAALGRVEDRVESAEPRWEETQRRVADVAVAVATLHPVLDALEQLRARVAALPTELPAPPVVEAPVVEPVDLQPVLDRIAEVARRIDALPTELPAPAVVEAPVVEPVDLQPVLDRIAEVARRVDALPTELPAPPVVEAPVVEPVDLQPVLDRIAELARHVDELPRDLPAPPAPPPPPERVDLSGVLGALARVEDRVESAEPRWEEIQRRVADLAVAVVALQPTIDAIVDLRSHVELVGGRLSTLLGGPTLTELMDRLDEIADRGNR